jgi:hypothetical protein
MTVEEYAMEVKALRWVGVHTTNYSRMIDLLGDVMGLRVIFEEDTTVEFSTTHGDRFQVMAPGDPYFEFFDRHARGPVPLFEVDDVSGAEHELRRSGIEVIGPIRRDSMWEWIHLRGPDRNLYELASRRSDHQEVLRVRTT